MVFAHANAIFWRFHNIITLTNVKVQIKYNLLQMKHVKSEKMHLLNVQYSIDYPLCEWQ
jgi:hypothetical protein